MSRHRFILLLSCKDVKGIVATVARFLFDQDGFIIASAQFGDESTGQFFMRAEFELPANVSLDTVKDAFAPIAKRFTMWWELHDASIKPRLLVLVSQYSHCLNDLLHRHQSGTLAAEIVGVVSNHEVLRPLSEWYEVPFHYLPVTAATKTQQEAAILTQMQESKADMMALARYMQILSPELVQAVSGRAINIHHSFLPGFKGARPYHQAYARGVKLIGATAHYVSNDLDEGPIIEQEVVRVDHTHAPEDLTALGRDVECLVLSRAIAYHAEHRVLINGGKTVVFK
jgi:formyltetrahydrofolate deformylase